MSEGYRIINMLKLNQYEDYESDSELHVLPDELFKNVVYDDNDDKYDELNNARIHDESDPIIVEIRLSVKKNKTLKTLNKRKKIMHRCVQIDNVKCKINDLHDVLKTINIREILSNMKKRKFQK